MLINLHIRENGKTETKKWYKLETTEKEESEAATNKRTQAYSLLTVWRNKIFFFFNSNQ